MGRAPLAPDGEFAEFVRGFSVRRELSFVCGPPRISLEVTYSGFELDTHFYAFELDSPGGTPVPEADYSFETIPSFTRIGCGTAVSPVDFSFAGFNFDSPAITFGYLHKGCLDAAVEAATRIGVRFDYMPTVLGYRIRCTFSHSQTAFEFVGQGRGRLGGSGFSDWNCDPRRRSPVTRLGAAGREMGQPTKPVHADDSRHRRGRLYEFPFEGLSSASSERLMRRTPSASRR